MIFMFFPPTLAHGLMKDCLNMFPQTSLKDVSMLCLSIKEKKWNPQKAEC